MGDVIVVVPKGRLRGDKGTDELTSTLRELVEHGEKKILLDLEKASIVGNRAIGALISIRVRAMKADSHFSMCNVDRRTREFLTTMKLIEPLGIHGSRAEALQALALLAG